MQPFSRQRCLRRASSTPQPRLGRKPTLIRYLPALATKVREKRGLNGLTKASAADALQIRCVSVDRFKEKLGLLEATLMAELTAAIALVVDFE